MSVIQVLDRPASQSFYAVAGRLLFVESFDRDLAQLIGRLFAGWQLTPVSSPSRSPDIKIVFFPGSDLPEIPSGLSLTQFDVAGGGRLHSATGEYYLQFQNSLLHLQTDDAFTLGPQASRLPAAVVDAAGSCRRDACGPRVSVFVWVRDIPIDAELARVTSFAVCAALRRFGMFELHSAGVVAPDSDDGVLIVGPSGGGKSTLTTQLARAGWSYLSDDELLLSVDNDEVEARGFRSFFALANSKGPTKNCFEPADTFTAPRVDRCAPRFVFFTKISGAPETRLQALTQPETMARLIRACPWATYDIAIAAPNLELLSRLARQARGFDLLAGTDLLESDRASQIIGAACRA